MDHFLDEENLPQYYSLVNKAQRNLTEKVKKTNKIDLFVILDISGSMNQTSNRVLNLGAGVLGFFGAIFGLDKITLTKLFNTRLEEAKKHIITQITNLINQNRINKLGLITFNHKAKTNIPLTDDFYSVIRGIKNQTASGSTALFDSIIYAQKQLEDSDNPRMLIMTDGQDNSSKQKIRWQEQWFKKSGLKSTFITICQGDTQDNRRLAQILHSQYIVATSQAWFSNSFNADSIANGIKNLR